MAASDPKTADYLSQIISERETREKREGLTYGPTAFRDGGSISEFIRSSRLVMPSEIMDLPPLHAYVKYPGYPWATTEIPVRDYPALVEPLILKDTVHLDGEEDTMPSMDKRDRDTNTSGGREYDRTSERDI